jgi:molybdate transport system substrate-binding protein
MRPGVAATVVVLAVVSACSPGMGALAQSSEVSLTIYGAASLTDALAAVKTAYERQRPGTTLVVATDSSTRLRTQIEDGAPADVFLSADQANPQQLVAAGLTDGAGVDFAGNVLTIIVPADNPAGIASPADLARTGVRIVATGDEVPIAKYARQVVANLASESGYPADFGARYEANVVSKEENVNAIVAKIELGEGDAAIVYATDARAASGVVEVPIPAPANVLATYAGVVVRASHSRDAAHDFLGWLAGPEGTAVLAVFGFQAPP